MVSSVLREKDSDKSIAERLSTTASCSLVNYIANGNPLAASEMFAFLDQKSRNLRQGKCTDEICKLPKPFKTKMCKFNAEGLCRNGAKCSFAHDIDQLHAPLEPAEKLVEFQVATATAQEQQEKMPKQRIDALSQRVDDLSAEAQAAKQALIESLLAYIAAEKLSRRISEVSASFLHPHSRSYMRAVKAAENRAHVALNVVIEKCCIAEAKTQMLACALCTRARVQEAHDVDKRLTVVCAPTETSCRDLESMVQASGRKLADMGLLQLAGRIPDAKFPNVITENNIKNEETSCTMDSNRIYSSV